VELMATARQAAETAAAQAVEEAARLAATGVVIPTSLGRRRIRIYPNILLTHYRNSGSRGFLFFGKGISSCQPSQASSPRPFGFQACCSFVCGGITVGVSEIGNIAAFSGCGVSALGGEGLAVVAEHRRRNPQTIPPAVFPVG